MSSERQPLIAPAYQQSKPNEPIEFGEVDLEFKVSDDTINSKARIFGISSLTAAET